MLVLTFCSYCRAEIKIKSQIKMVANTDNTLRIVSHLHFRTDKIGPGSL